MFASKPLIILCATIFGGAALAWILPPTTPIGGPTVAELKRSPMLATNHAPPVFEPLPPQPIFDPGIRRLDLTDRASPLDDRPVPVEEAAGYSDRQPYFTDPERAFRHGYKLARREDLTDPEECEQFEDQAQVDGCRSYVERFDEQAESRFQLR